MKSELKRLAIQRAEKILVVNNGFNTATYTIPSKCNHKNGWYITVKFWFIKKSFFVCSDCGEPIVSNL